MSIKLDWEVESTTGLSRVDEDPREIEARRRHARRLRIGTATVLIILLAVGLAIAYRLITVGQRMRADLEATVAAETLALRIGDREAYLANQMGVDNWQQTQGQTFERYQAETAQTEVTGQIVRMDIDANLARVTLREVYKGTDYNVLWFYRHDATGWKHVAAGPSVLGERHEYHSAHFDFFYYLEDQALVDILSGRLDNWWEIACSLTSCESEAERAQVEIEPEWLAQPGWDPRSTRVAAP